MGAALPPTLTGPCKVSIQMAPQWDPQHWIQRAAAQGPLPVGCLVHPPRILCLAPGQVSPRLDQFRGNPKFKKRGSGWGRGAAHSPILWIHLFPLCVLSTSIGASSERALTGRSCAKMGGGRERIMIMGTQKKTNKKCLCQMARGIKSIYRERCVITQSNSWELISKAEQ